MELHPILPLLLVFLLSQLSDSISHGCHEDERIALLNFKSFLTDPSGRLSSWVGKNCCNWHGIHCSESFHVVSVDLPNPTPENFMRNINSELIPIPSGSTAINGTISPSLFTLTHLKYLDLSFNNFQFSKIPLQMANLKHLSYLNLSNSKFSASITTQFANLSSLQYLDISCSFRIKDFSSMAFNFSTSKESSYYQYSYYTSSYISSTDLSWLRGLVNLRELNLTGVDLSMASSRKNWAEPISFLSDLRVLVLSDCSISSPIPIFEFQNLSSLNSLLMDFNSINMQFPIQLANFTSLSTLDLVSTHLRGSIPYLPQLQQLSVDANPNIIMDLTGMLALPWPNLQTFSISSINVVGSIPSSISNISKLVYFDGSNCGIQGSIPTSISNLSNLQYLDLSYNNITGYLPFSTSSPDNLELLKIVQNNLEGPIPESICEISSLQRLRLGGNKISGKIPSCIGNLSNLQMFNLATNSLEGTVSLVSLFRKSYPSSIVLGLSGVNVESFKYPFPSNFQPKRLELKSCNLNGSIPTFICDLTLLSTLDLAANNLTGVIPSCLFKLPDLSYLDLSGNKLHGVVPHFLHLNNTFITTKLGLKNNNLQGPLPLPPENIEVLDFSFNKFSGGIPSEVGRKLSKARFVSFSGNELSGPIPNSICSPGYVMVSLNLSHNQLSGPIPSSLKHCYSLISLSLQGNYLTGQVPNELEWEKNLKTLQLQDNNLEGPFPSFIRQLHDLQVLNLGNNNFLGRIPAFIGDLQNLQILVLSSNSFNESIPKEITYLRKLQFLDLSSNNLSGHIPHNISNLEMLISRPKTRTLLGYETSFEFSGVQLEIVTKGFTQQLVLVFSDLSGIDLSCNTLSGNIPQEIGQLKGLYMLNLSHNFFSGSIPTSVGDMVGLESLDLSFNHLAGVIPQGLTLIDFLTTLNLSYNNLSGMIPRGIHFDTLSLDGSAFIGNELLCGPPSRKSCYDDSHTNANKEEDNKVVRRKWLFYRIVALGHGVGFCGLFLVLACKQKWWSEYWRCVDNLALEIVGCMSKK